MTLEVILQLVTLLGVLGTLLAQAKAYGRLVERVDTHEKRLDAVQDDLDGFAKSLFDRILKAGP